jgi:xanthine dehydrogenase accessory factor
MQLDIFEEIARLRRDREPAALATVVAAKGSTPAKVPARMIIHQDGRTMGTVGGGCLEADIIRAARDVIDTGRPKTFHFRLSGEEAERTGIACGGMVDIMVESLEQPWAVIVGAGHVAQAVARLAAKVGFRVAVVDDRPDFACRERFPEADEITVCEYDHLGREVKTGPQSYILIMTRGHSEDYRVLQWALTTPARYLGVLGSRSKRVQFLEALRAEGRRPEDLEALHMPVGLEIGAETVDEIAVSVVAELISERRKAARPQ